MIAAMYFEHFMVPSLSDLKQRRLAERGLADGIADKPAASEAQAYTGAYERGLRFGRATRRELALVFGDACRCPACATVYHDATSGTCGCSFRPTELQWGLEVLYGPGEPDDECDFFGPDDLKRLCREGVQIQSMDGEILNPQILVQ